MEIIRGATYTLGIKLSDDSGEIVDNNNVEEIEFSFNDTIKKYPTDVEYDSSTNNYLVKLSQEETFAFDRTLAIQCRVKYKTNEVLSTDISYSKVNNSLSENIL